MANHPFGHLRRVRDKPARTHINHVFDKASERRVCHQLLADRILILMEQHYEQFGHEKPEMQSSRACSMIKRDRFMYLQLAETFVSGRCHHGLATGGEQTCEQK